MGHLSLESWEQWRQLHSSAVQRSVHRSLPLQFLPSSSLPPQHCCHLLVPATRCLRQAPPGGQASPFPERSMVGGSNMAPGHSHQEDRWAARTRQPSSGRIQVYTLADQHGSWKVPILNLGGAPVCWRDKGTHTRHTRTQDSGRGSILNWEKHFPWASSHSNLTLCDTCIL